MLELAFIVDPLSSLKVAKDSSIAMMRAASERNHLMYALEMSKIFWKDGVIYAAAQQLQMAPQSTEGIAWYEAGPAMVRPLSDFSAVIVRKDPPFDQEYLYGTYLLDAAVAQGAKIYNHPQAIRDHNEKLSLAKYVGYSPPTLVTSRPQLIQEFIEQETDVILKPLDAMGGASIFRVTPQDPNRNVIVETITGFGTRTVMAQRYVPAITQGDKRILLIAGQPIPYALARIPKPGETRGNLAAGGTGIAQPLSPRDQEIAQTVGPKLWQAGLLLVGLDIIGDWLTEINVTSPTCFVEIKHQTGFDVAELFISTLETITIQT